MNSILTICAVLMAFCCVFTVVTFTALYLGLRQHKIADPVIASSEFMIVETSDGFSFVAPINAAINFLTLPDEPEVPYKVEWDGGEIAKLSLETLDRFDDQYIDTDEDQMIITIRSMTNTLALQVIDAGMDEDVFYVSRLAETPAVK